MKSVLLLLLGSSLALAAEKAPEPLDLRKFAVVKEESGPVNYYSFVEGPSGSYLHAQYKPPLKTTTLGYRVPDDERQSVRAIAWKWRAATLPVGGNECVKGKGDSAAAVMLMWKRGLKWYELKYVWSTDAKKGATCLSSRGMFLARDSVILQSGPPLGQWITEKIDVRKAFIDHFEDGNPKASVPDFVGLGLFTDGDQTESESAADYADFVISR